MTRERIVPSEPGPHYPFDLPEQATVFQHRGESNGHNSSISAHETVARRKPSKLEQELIDFALNNNQARTGIVQKTSENETVSIEYTTLDDGTRVIKKIDVNRD